MLSCVKDPKSLAYSAVGFLLLVEAFLWAVAGFNPFIAAAAAAVVVYIAVARYRG